MASKEVSASRPCISLPAPLLLAWRRLPCATGGLSARLRRALEDDLAAAGVPAPEPTTPPRTAAATHAAAELRRASQR